VLHTSPFDPDQLYDPRPPIPDERVNLAAQPTQCSSHWDFRAELCPGLGNSPSLHEGSGLPNQRANVHFRPIPALRAGRFPVLGLPAEPRREPPCNIPQMTRNSTISRPWQRFPRPGLR